MCFVRYLSGIVCTLCMVASMRRRLCFSDKKIFEEIFGIPPCAPGTYAAVPGYTLIIVEFD
jgi:hypothetical protein